MDAADAVEFIPDIGDNRDLENGEQVWCELLPMTGEEVRSYQRTMAGVKPGSPQALKKAEIVGKRIVSERVLVLHNYSDIKGEPISDGASLFDRGEPAMVDEIYDALTSISKLKAGARKN